MVSGCRELDERVIDLIGIVDGININIILQKITEKMGIFGNSRESNNCIAVVVVLRQFYGTQGIRNRTIGLDHGNRRNGGYHFSGTAAG